MKKTKTKPNGEGKEREREEEEETESFRDRRDKKDPHEFTNDITKDL